MSPSLIYLCQVNEARAEKDEGRLKEMEASLQEAKDVAEKSDTAYAEVAHKLGLVEIELDKAEERGEMAESKSSELDEELKNLANNLR